MSLLAGQALDPTLFFSSGNPVRQGSSFDLTIGRIFDADGREPSGPFILRPGHIVQVVSAEIFALPNDVTGHATYKTTLTKDGIWALTVGIVDPGWDGPLTTTLLNFSQVPYPISVGSAFLRISFFKHEPVPESLIRKCKSIDGYVREVQEKAMTKFAPTFMNHAKVVADASDEVLEKIQKRALGWVGAVAGLFALLALVLGIAQFVFAGWSRGSLFENDADSMRQRITGLETKLDRIEKNVSSSPEGIANTTEVPSVQTKRPVSGAPKR
jgi:hypothetical protein